jgi:hypothetical protein
MKDKRIDTEIRIVYNRPGFDTANRHHVRSRMEAKVCDWLQSHGVAHRHASEVFTVPAGPGRVPTVYVPDILLHDRTADGKTIIIEPYQVHVPKGGGTRLLAAFRKMMKKKYYVIVIARKPDFKNLVKGSYDLRLDIERLDFLAKRIPLPMD